MRRIWNWFIGLFLEKEFWNKDNPFPCLDYEEERRVKRLYSERRD